MYAPWRLISVSVTGLHVVPRLVGVEAGIVHWEGAGDGVGPGGVSASLGLATEAPNRFVGLPAGLAGPDGQHVWRP